MGWGATLLHVLITVSACDHLLRTLSPRAVPPLAPRLVAVLNTLHPHGGWLVLLFSVALLWVATRGSRGEPARRASASTKTGRS